ncbi:MAG: TolB family protein [Cyanobacteria bacterium SBLK]|nr:TolB family protein [Cyanobacteria bacterium SBLK]
MKRFSQPNLIWAIAFLAIALLSGCGKSAPPIGSVSLNSRYNDQEPAISGDGRILAFITNRNGISQIAVYNLRLKRFIELPGLNQGNQIAESPSLSRTGRYLVYLVSDRGRPAIALYDRAISKVNILTTSYRNWIRNPKISPDGRYVVFETSRRGQWDIEVLDRGPDIELDVADGTPLF